MSDYYEGGDGDGNDYGDDQQQQYEDEQNYDDGNGDGYNDQQDEGEYQQQQQQQYEEEYQQQQQDEGEYQQQEDGGEYQQQEEEQQQQDYDEQERQHDDYPPEEYDDGPVEAVAASIAEAGEGGGAGGATGHGSDLGSVFGDLLGNFGGVEGVMGQLSNIGSGQGGLSNLLASGAVTGAVEKLVGSAAHRFLGIDAATGAIIGAIAGNVLFELGGKGNSLGNVGKIVLDNIISGKYKRNITPWSPPPASGLPSFHLDFNAERQKCLQEHRLFEDPEFPASDRALVYSRPPRQRIEWKRPGEITNDPQLIVGGQSRFDVVQGSLGDCWLLAAVASITLRDELFYRVVPPDQSFTENYAGIFHFQFWRYGQWVDVVIDDKLPTVDGELIYMHSEQHNEFWSALLEKAYAKLYGSYEALKGGSTSEALEDFTGGLTEALDLKTADRSTLLATLMKGFQTGALFGCSIDPDPNETEAKLSNGLVRGHAYSITAVKNMNLLNGGQAVLVRCRNPWGNETEWNGAWSDGSSEWQQVSVEHRPNPADPHDGEFWMDFDDWRQNFEQLEMCTLSAAVMAEIAEMTGLDESALKKATVWSESTADGQWSQGAGTAGGCRNDIRKRRH